MRRGAAAFAGVAATKAGTRAVTSAATYYRIRMDVPPAMSHPVGLLLHELHVAAM
jgi:hypothetical protein